MSLPYTPSPKWGLNRLSTPMLMVTMRGQIRPVNHNYDHGTVSYLFHTVSYQRPGVRANVGLVVVVAAGGQPCLVATGGQPGFGQPSCAWFDFPQVLFISIGFVWFLSVSNAVHQVLGFRINLMMLCV